MTQPDCTTVRVIASKHHKTPIYFSLSKDSQDFSSVLQNEENIIIGFGVHNPKTLKTSFGIYNVVDGIPRISRWYNSGGHNGIKVAIHDHAAPINWLQGITEKALIGKLREGNYRLTKEAADLDKRKLKLPLNLKSCLELANFIKPTSVSVPFDIWVVDEVGAPNLTEEFQIDSDKLRWLVTNRFLSNMCGVNPQLFYSFKNAVVRGQQLKQYLFGQEAVGQLEAIQESLRQQVIEHAKTVWCDNDGKLRFPWLSNHGAILNRIIDFYIDLVSPGSIALQRCASVHEVSTPLFVGVMGNPVTVGKIDLPANWKFPQTWKTSPFESLKQDSSAGQPTKDSEIDLELSELVSQ